MNVSAIKWELKGNINQKKKNEIVDLRKLIGSQINIRKVT